MLIGSSTPLLDFYLGFDRRTFFQCMVETGFVFGLERFKSFVPRELFSKLTDCVYQGDAGVVEPREREESSLHFMLPSVNLVPTRIYFSQIDDSWKAKNFEQEK